MKKRPVVVCTDPGIDDFIALCMLLDRPELDVLGIVALSGNVGLDVTVNNALVVKELCRQPEIPVLAGSAKPLKRPVRSASNIHGQSGLGKSVCLHSELPVWDEDGAEFIARTARAHAGELELVSLGPLTDVALAVTRHPEIVPMIRDVLIMGGGIHRGNATRYAEFNIVADPEAAAEVFASGVHVTMVGLDATHRCVMPRSSIEAMRYDSVLGRAVPAMLGDYADIYRSVHGIEGMIIHDAICVVMLWHPEWFTCHEWHVHVCLDESEHLGQTVADETGGSGLAPNCTVAMDCDSERINDCIVRSMRSLIERIG